MKKVKSKANYYVDNGAILEEIRAYKKSKIMSELLGSQILSIARHLANKGNFAGYSWREDMIGEAVLICVKYVDRFDESKYEKPNPFAYITTICRNAFITYIKMQNRHSDIKNTLYNGVDGNYAGISSDVALDYTEYRT